MRLCEKNFNKTNENDTKNRNSMVPVGRDNADVCINSFCRLRRVQKRTLVLFKKTEQIQFGKLRKIHVCTHTCCMIGQIIIANKI